MKVIIGVFSLVFFSTCIAADEDSLPPNSDAREERPGSTPAICPTTDYRFYRTILEAGSNCMKLAVDDSLAQQLRNASTLEEHRDGFKRYCQKQSVVRSCLAETTVTMESCQNDTLSTLFKVYRDTLETVLDIGCVDDGEKIAAVFYQIKDFSENKQKINSLRVCFERYAYIYEDLESSTIDISSKLYILQKEYVKIAECFDRIETHTSFKQDVKYFMDVIINRMKCVHPQDGNLVPCVTIDAGLIRTTNICDMKTSGTEIPLYDLLEEDIEASVTQILEYSDEDMNDNDIRSLVETECKYRSDVNHLLNRPRILSEACLNATQQNEFQLHGDFIKSAYEVACLEDGRRVADITVEVYRLRRTGQGHAVFDCIDLATSTRNATGVQTSTSKNMRFYHELEAFKGCLVNKLQGHQTSVDAATSLIDEVLKKVKCAGLEEGSTVLCEKLANKTVA